VRNSYYPKRVVVFSVPGAPAPWHVHTRWSKSASKSRLKTYQELIRIVASGAMAGRHPHDGPVTMEIEFFRPIPKSAPRGAAARQKWVDKHTLMAPDLSNYNKGAEDALNGVVYVDDSCVVGLQTYKDYTEGEGETRFVINLL